MRCCSMTLNMQIIGLNHHICNIFSRVYKSCMLLSYYTNFFFFLVITVHYSVQYAKIDANNYFFPIFLKITRDTCTVFIFGKRISTVSRRFHKLHIECRNTLFFYLWQHTLSDKTVEIFKKTK